MTGLNLIAFVALACVTGGVVQTLTGFGCGIILMLFFVYAMPILEASGLAMIIGTIVAMTLLYSFRHHVQYRLVIFPAIVNFVAATFGLKVAEAANLVAQKIAFSLCLIALSIYFMYFSDRIRLKGNVLTATVCSILSGFVNGMFGIGGPPMALYYLTVTDSKETYIATTQLYFVLICAYSTITRIIDGIVTTDMFGLIVVGLLGVLGGQMIGIRIIKHVSLDLMKKMVYIFLAVAGIINLVGCF